MSTTKIRKQVTIYETKRVGQSIGIDWKASLFDITDLRDGIMVELEHTDVTGGDLTLTAKIALAHLLECPDYYRRLKPMEEACKREAGHEHFLGRS